MKLHVIICASVLAVGTLAFNTAHLNAHDVEYLNARALDPKTMDLTRLSVLSVLRTAVPSGSAFPTPASDAASDWYQKLPEDIKSLLPSLYPATREGLASSSAPVRSSPPTFAPMSPSEMASPGVFTAVSVSSSLPFRTPKLTITKTLQSTPSATAVLRVPTNDSFTSSAPINRTLATTQPSPSGYFSAGARAAMNMEVPAVLAWTGIGVGFLIFA